nr:hypothetical protein [Tanacetum cinerariifolium]
MTSFGYRLNPCYAIKECSSCGALYTGDFCCSKGNVEDMILVPKLPKNYARCARCEHPVDDPYCQGCALFRKKLEEDLNLGVNSSQNPPHIDECCYECGDALDGIFCQQCTCKSCGKGFDQTQPPQFLVIHPPPQETSIKILHDQENAINSVQTFLRKFNHYSFFETPKVLLLAWDRVFETKDTFGNKQYKPKDIHELFRKLFNDVQNIHEELAKYINTPGWNRPAFYNNGDDDDVDYTIAITPILSIEEPDNSLSMRDEHLDTIPKTKSNEIIKSIVEDLVPIPSESEGSPDTIDDDSLYNENIEYVEASPHDFELVSLEVAEIVISEDEEIEDDNLREKLLNVNLLEAKFNSNIEFLLKTKEQLEEEENKAIQSINETPTQKAAKRGKLNEKVEDLKQHLEIVPDEDDDVYIEASPLARKVPVVDYEIIHLNNKSHYKMIRADGTHQLPDGQAQVWKNQRTVHGQAKVKSWKLLESCSVHIITFTNTQLILLVERRYPLLRFTLDQMLNAVRLRVKDQSEMSLELLRFTRQQHQEGQLE